MRRLGGGAMGVVWEAIDPDSGRRLALKVLRSVSEDAELHHRFKREFRLLKEIQHPNLITLGELFSDADEWFFTMELVDGVDLLSFVRAGKAKTRAATAEGATSLHERARVKGGATFDERRVRDAVRQLASALEVTHAAGVVHRDVKPPNVLVTADGRVVVLDFGVATEVRAAGGATDSLVGTPAYMAPEQALSGAASPAADMYSVGVILFEALTGVRPVEGSAVSVMTKKQAALAATPKELVAGAPEDLSALAAELLAIDPAKRPTAHDVAQRLAPKAEAKQRRMLESGTVRARPFVGRGVELLALQEAHVESRAGKPVSVLVRGESGIGKTALLGHFVGGLEAESADVVVLRGRCRESEWIPFKAFDGIMDDVARLLARHGRDAAAILPVHAEQLTQVFPAFREVVPAKPRGRARAEDPIGTRSRLFACVRELFARLAERFAVVVMIDDLQWADPDSLSLLRELTRPPDAPPVLLLMTAREGDGETPAGARLLSLSPLSAEDSVALVRAMGAREGMDAESIAREGQGHPMFLAELVQHGASLRLDDALHARLDALDAAPRRVLDLLSLAGRPSSVPLLARAADLGVDEAARVVAALRGQSVVRAAGPRGDMVEPYHDRIREVAVGALAPEAKVELHRRLGTALEAEKAPDREALAVHWRGAGDEERAVTYAAEAAREASAALAFAHAARLYESILASPSLPAADEAQYAAALGEALVRWGRSARAAEAFHRAARRAPPAFALPLLQKAAEHELRAGLIEQGLRTMHEVLGALGMSPPKERLWLALLSFLFWRMVLRLRGTRFVKRAAFEIEPRRLAAIDVCWSASFSLSAVDPIRGTDFQTRQLLLALRAGEPTRVLRALALEAPYLAGPGAASLARTRAMIARCDALAREVGDPLSLAFVDGTAGIALYLAGRFTEALERLDRGEAELATQPGVWGEMVRVRRFAISSLMQTGRFAELCARVPRHTREAQERGDLHALTNLSIGPAHLAWLVEDRPAEGRAQLRDAMERWKGPGFLLEHLYALFAETSSDLYTGDPAAARERVDERWPALERSVLLRIPSARLLCVGARARSMLALAAADRTRASLADDVHRLARSIQGRPSHHTWPAAALLRAGALRVQGKTDDAAAVLAEAAARFDAHGMLYLAAVARRAQGKLEGGDAGRARIEAAETAMKQEGILDVARFAAVWAPGL